MHDLQSRCFADQSKMRLLRAGHMCADERAAFVVDVCGDLALRPPTTQPRTASFALATRTTRTGRLLPFVFRTYDFPPQVKSAGETLPGTSEARLAQAIEATSAAPFMFPRATLEGRERLGGLSDGGMVANDPTRIALEEAQALFPQRPLGLVVSLGTGATEEGAASEAEVRRLQEVQAAVEDRGGTYYRFQPVVDPDVSAVCTDEAVLQRMERDTRQQFRDSPQTSELIRRLRFGPTEAATAAAQEPRQADPSPEEISKAKGTARPEPRDQPPPTMTKEKRKAGPFAGALVSVSRRCRRRSEPAAGWS